ncbi:MAG: prepilin-type N-terminal cleavage/methylation domain-containing protein, partial [Clostridiaceae bacterium]|nr:prepilin-type N-terminal cleavage/methylation domain-containing protein [Clostridiaceae bacterium]
MQKDHRGITLVELLIAMAISAVIMAAAAFFLMTAQKNYREAAASADVQSETQILMGQIGTWIMEGNRIKIESVAGGTVQNKLTVYQIPERVTAADPASKRVIWLSADGKLYMKKFDGIADPDADLTDIAPGTDEVKANCIGEYVTGFTVSKTEAKVTVTL